MKPDDIEPLVEEITEAPKGTKRIYLLGYMMSGHVAGRIFNYRSTRDAPSVANIESIEAQLSAKYNTRAIIISVSQISL